MNKFAYSVSKLGVNSLKMSAAVDLAPFNIRVNAISIGPTGSPVGSKENPGRKRQYESNALAGHIGLPSDVADAVSFLVSEKARYIRGNSTWKWGRGHLPIAAIKQRFCDTNQA